MATFFFTQEQNIEMIVEDGKPMGGAVVATQVWMRAMYELGHKIVLFRFEEDNRIILPEFDWIETKKIYSSKKGIPVLRWVYYRLPKLYKALREVKPDVVFDSIPSWGSPITSILCKIVKSKYLIRLANDNMLDERFKLTHSLFERNMIKLGFKVSDFILVQNTFQLEKIKLKFPKKEVLKSFNPYQLNLGFLVHKNKPKGYIAWVANFRFQKNLKLLYDIALIIPFEQIFIAGELMSNLDSETVIYLEKLKLLSNVRFIGSLNRKEILDFFKKCKFLLNTSRYEGFSNTFLEAMCTGTPILSTENVNPDNIISQNNLGYIYSNPADLSQYLQSIDNKEYSKQSQNCIEFVQAHHDHLNLGKKLLDFLNIK